MANRDLGAGPLHPLATAISHTCEQLGSRWQSLSQDVEQHRMDLQSGVCNMLAELGQRLGHPMRCLQDHHGLSGVAGLAVRTGFF